MRSFMLSNIPKTEEGEWITVEDIDCVVTKIINTTIDTNLNSKFGHYEVVFNPNKPTNCNVYWNGSVWSWCETGSDYGGYANNYPRLKKFIAILKDGRNSYSG